MNNTPQSALNEDEDNDALTKLKAILTLANDSLIKELISLGYETEELQQNTTFLLKCIEEIENKKKPQGTPSLGPKPIVEV